MDEFARKVRTHLVLTLGFSRLNAEIAIEMFHRGELTRMEEEVINYVQLNPSRDEYPPSWFLGGDDCHVRAMERLNLRITLAGGDAVTRRKRVN